MDLKQQLAAKKTAISDFRLKCKGREMTDAETDQLEALCGEAEQLDAKVKAEERRAAAAARADGLLVAATEHALSTRRVPPVTDPAPSAPEGSLVAKPAAMRDPRRGFNGLGEFGMQVMNLHTPGRVQTALQDERMQLLLSATGQSQGVPSEGGVMVPPAFSTTIWDGLRNAPDSLVNDCDLYTIEGDSLSLPAVDETSRATGSRWGALQGYWRAEATQMNATKIKLREVKLEAHELYVFCAVTDKLLRNSPIALEQLLTRGATEEINFLFNDAIVEGTGAGKPMGYKKSPATIAVAKEALQAADTIVRENVDKMWSRCHARWRANAFWAINQDAEPALEQLSAAVGTGGVPIYLPPGGITETPNARLKGRPVRVLEFADTIGDLGDISLVSLKAYALGVQGTLESAMSMHLRFDYGESVFRWTFRGDGQPWPLKALTPFKGAGTLSPFVNLAERA